MSPPETTPNSPQSKIQNPKSKIHFLPARAENAPENMALDFLLLQRYSDPAAIRFRHYAWRNPAITFGYSQKFETVHAQHPGCEIVRRPTGGGIVDHRHDWTYALVIPRHHPFYKQPAPLTYREIHLALAAALRAQNILATLQPAPSETQSPATACFQQAEPNDVILPDSRKLAGAALKRNQNGLLLQGSIARASIPETFDWLRFAADFPAHLAAALSAQPEEIAFPDFPPEAQTALTDQFSSPAWNRRR